MTLHQKTQDQIDFLLSQIESTKRQDSAVQALTKVINELSTTGDIPFVPEVWNSNGVVSTYPSETDLNITVKRMTDMARVLFPLGQMGWRQSNDPRFNKSSGSGHWTLHHPDYPDVTINLWAYLQIGTTPMSCRRVQVGVQEIPVWEVVCPERDDPPTQ